MGNSESKPDLRIDYIELPTTDVAKTKQFYGNAFGWSFVDYGPAYVAFTGAFVDGGFELGAPVSPRLSGDDAKEKKRATSGALVVLYASDLERALDSVVRAGGEIFLGIYSFPGGRRFHFIDPSGNELAVWSE